MAEALEDLGISVLVNETLSIRRAGAWLHVTGTDDVHHFYTDGALTALSQVPEGFKMALVHSAELADVAADQGFHLYLAGHTHGGQICLPGGRPILTNLICHRRYASGLWRHGPMLGYTTTGVGVAVLPVRFNCRGQVVLLALRRKAT
jgi:predicted MPP superfamily phosphohydrolase